MASLHLKNSIRDSLSLQPEPENLDIDRKEDNSGQQANAIKRTSSKKTQEFRPGAMPHSFEEQELIASTLDRTESCKNHCEIDKQQLEVTDECMPNCYDGHHTDRPSDSSLSTSITSRTSMAMSNSSFQSESSRTSLLTTDSGFQSESISSSLSLNAGSANEECDIKPRNFSWVIEDLLCACAWPGTSGELGFLSCAGVTTIVSLTAERELPQDLVRDFEAIRVKVVDMSPPTLEQIVQVVDIVDKAELHKKKVAVHCAAGKGRTGVMLACVLVKRRQMEAQQAVNTVRHLRPGSVETGAQAEAVHRFEVHLKKIKP